MKEAADFEPAQKMLDENAALLPLGGAPDDDEADGAPMVDGEGGAEPG